MHWLAELSKMYIITATIFLTLVITASNASPRDPPGQGVPEDARLNFTQLALKYGAGTCEEHEVVTEDGYILKVFHIPGNKSRPVFFEHGFLVTSDDYVLRGNTSMAIRVAKAGYDVWLGNVRGNRYSRRHVSMVPEENPKFWDFSMHEHGYYDLPAMIDYVLLKTGQKELNLIAMSQGTMVSFLMQSTRPEYCDRVKAYIALAPIGSFHNPPKYLKKMMKYRKLVEKMMSLSKTGEIGGYYTPWKDLIEFMCTKRVNTAACMHYLMYSLVGFDPAEYETEFIQVIFGHTMGGTSRKSFQHIFQMLESTNFAYFDYGPRKNLKKYGSIRPPDYDYQKMKIKTYLMSAKNDRYAPPNNVRALKQALPNVAESYVMESASSNHISFIWGRRDHLVACDHVLDILAKNNRIE